MGEIRGGLAKSLSSLITFQLLPLRSPFFHRFLPLRSSMSQYQLLFSPHNRFHHRRAVRRRKPYLGAPGLLLPPLEGGQVGVQPCAQVVEEDHVERDAHQGIEDTEDLACLRAGRQVAVSCRGREECADMGKREFRTASPIDSRWSSSITSGGVREAPLFPRTFSPPPARMISICKNPACL